MVGNLTNLNLSEGSLLGGKKCSSLGLSFLEKLGPSGKEPDGMLAGIMASRFPISEVLMRESLDKEAELEVVPTTTSSPEAMGLMTGSRR